MRQPTDDAARDVRPTRPRPRSTVARAKASLRTAHTLEPSRLRRACLDAIASVVPADTVAFWTLAHSAGALTLQGELDTGALPDGFWSAYRALPFPNAFFDPARPPASSVNRFESATHRGFRERLERDARVEALWRSTGVADQLRTYAYRDDVFLGLIGAFRFEASEPFTRRETQRAAALLPELVASLTLAATACPSTPADFVLTPAGELELVSPAASDWLERADLRDQLRAVVRTLERGETPSSPALRAAWASWTRLESPGASHRYLVHVRPWQPAIRAAGSHLTPTQQTVANYLATGATLPELARSLGITTETAKTHAKAVYAKLGVRSRVELRAAWTPRR